MATITTTEDIMEAVKTMVSGNTALTTRVELPYRIKGISKAGDWQYEYASFAVAGKAGDIATVVELLLKMDNSKRITVKVPRAVGEHEIRYSLKPVYTPHSLAAELKVMFGLS